MPGHFTHIYTARRVADLLASGGFEDWPHAANRGINALRDYDPQFCGEIMKKWEKFTAIGAVGPDLFYFSQDYSKKDIGPKSDNIMLQLATLYYLDAAKESDWDPLLAILAEANGEMASVLRIMIKLQKMWRRFEVAWNDSVGPIVNGIGNLADDLLGGALSELQTGLNELKTALLLIGKEEALTFADIFSWLDTVVEKGWPETSFLWSDMLHYRRTSAFAEALVVRAEGLKDGEDGQNRYEQFLAYALGYITHLGTDTIGHSWVNAQCGGPFRHHPQRHHIIENHVDAWNYKNGGTNADPIANPCPTDPWAATKDYPDISMSALWFAVQMTPDEPQGQQRPSPLPVDNVEERKQKLDVDGEMPDWMAESIVLAMIKTFHGHPHPEIYQGDEFQASINADVLTKVVKKVIGKEADKTVEELLAGIAPTPSFSVPRGFPLPWQIQTMYRLMITFYKFSYNGTWELQKPKKPDLIIVPPSSDFKNLFQPPDFSGVDSSNPAIGVCEAVIALFEWAMKEIGAAVNLAGDLIKMVTSPGTYPIRLGLWELSMMVWDVSIKTHELMAHTGFVMPHGEQFYDDGELRLPNEIDIPLITLGSSADSAFAQALADAVDPMGNLDRNPDVIVDHPVPDRRYPLYPVIQYSLNQPDKLQMTGWEYRRPWAYPDGSIFKGAAGDNIPVTTPTESYEPRKTDADAPAGPLRHLHAGPYVLGTRPDDVFFRTTVPVDPVIRAKYAEIRTRYEQAATPFVTDSLNASFFGDGLSRSPLGDPVPFSAYLIGRLANNTGYKAQFNLDGDRGYGYLTWDWIRNAGNLENEKDGMFTYTPPVVQPVGDDRWLPPSNHLADVGLIPMQVEYVDPPVAPSPLDLRARARVAKTGKI